MNLVEFVIRSINELRMRSTDDSGGICGRYLAEFVDEIYSIAEFVDEI
jgi:hypothetical protein